MREADERIIKEGKISEEEYEYGDEWGFGVNGCLWG